MRKTARIDRTIAEDGASSRLTVPAAKDRVAGHVFRPVTRSTAATKARLTSKSQDGAAESGAGARRAIALGLLGAGALVGIGAPAASAAVTAAPEPNAVEAAMPVASGAVDQAHPADWSRFGQIKLYPLAGTGVDPLSNVVGTNLSGLPVSTAPVNAVFSDGLPLSDLPVVGTVLAPPAVAIPALPAAAAPAALANPDADSAAQGAAASAPGTF
jgi:hypothetical protein